MEKLALKVGQNLNADLKFKEIACLAERLISQETVFERLLEQIPSQINRIDTALRSNNVQLSPILPSRRRVSSRSLRRSGFFGGDATPSNNQHSITSFLTTPT